MSERIATGEVFIEVNDRDALARLNKIRAEYHRAMQAIDREEAEVTISGDLDKLKDDVANARRMLKQLEGQQATVTIDADKKQLQKDVAEAKKLIKELEAEKATIELEVKGEENVRKAEERLRQLRDKRHAAEIRHAEQQAALAKKLYDENLRRASQESKVRESLHRQRMRELSQAEREAYRMEKDRQKAQRQMLVGVHEERVQVLKLQQDYAKTTDHLERLHKQFKTTFGREARAKVELDIASAEAKMRALKARLNEMGAHPPVDIKVDINRSLGSRAAEFGAGLLDRAAKLKDLTLRIGPFTTSIKGAITALGFLGPTLVDVAGAATSLVGVLGTGLVGAASLGAGAVGALGVSLGGVGMLLPSLLRDFGNLNTMQDAYHKAVLKYGAASDQAKKKLTEFNHALGAVSPTTRRAFLSIDQLQDRWRKMAQTVRPDFFDAVGATIQTLNHHFGWFSKNTQAAFKILSGGWQDWMRGLRGGEATKILETLGKRGNAALRPLMDGVGSLVTWFGRIAESASRFLKPLADSFKNWAQGLADGVANGDRLDATLDRLVGHAKDVGKLALAAFRLLATVLNGGADAGDNMVVSMTNALNRWNDFLRSPDGKRGMTEFFARAESGARALVGAILPLIASFVNWATAISPAVTQILKFVAAIAKAATGITNFINATGTLPAVVATFGAMFAVTKIAAFAAYLARVVGLLREVNTARGLGTALATIGSGGLKGGAVRGVATGAAEAGGMVALGKTASKARGEVGLLRAAATAVIPAIGSMGTVAGAAATGGLALAAGAAAFGAYKLLTMKSASDKLRDSLQQIDTDTRNLNTATQRHADATVAAGVATRSYRDDVRRVAALKKDLNKLEQDGKKNTDEYRAKLDELNQSLISRQTNEQNVRKYMGEASRASQDQTKFAQKTKDAQDKLNDALERQKRAQAALKTRELYGMDTTRQKKELAEATEDVARAQGTYNRNLAAQQHAARQAAVNAMNYERALRNLIPISGQAGTAIANLYQKSKSVTRTISLKFADPKDAGRVANAANRALAAGVKPQRVRFIVEGAKTAEDAIRRLNRYKLDSKQVRILTSGGAKAVAELERITGKKIPEKSARIIAKGGPAALREIERIAGIDLKDKVASLRMRDLASAVIAAVAGKRVGDKKVNINAKDNASPIISLFQGVKTIGQRIVEIVTRRKGKATGGVVDPAEKRMPFVEDRALARAAASSPQKTRGGRYSRPTLLVGEEDREEFVISTNPAYRSQNRDYLRAAASRLGIETARKGKAPLKPKYKKGAGADPDNLKAVKKYESTQQEEEDQNRKISIAESKVKEPDTLIREKGRDANGEPIYEVDQEKVNTYKSQMEAVKSLYDGLLNKDGIMDRIKQAAQDAYAALKTYRANRNTNIDSLEATQRANRAIMNNKKSPKDTRDKARDRYEDAKRMIDAEKGKIKDSNETQERIKDDQHDAGFRRQEYQIARDGLVSDIAAVQSSAEADRDRSNPQAAPAGGTSTERQPTAGEKAVSEADRIRALTDAGLPGGAASVADAITTQIAAQNTRLGEGEAMLKDNDPSNDMEANDIITSAANAIKSLTDELKNLPGSAAQAAQQYMTYGSALQGLLSSFGSNFAMATGFGAATAASRSLAPKFSFGMNPAMQGYAPSGFAAGAGRNIVINNTFPTPPADPHTWSKGIMFELQAAD